MKFTSLNSPYVVLSIVPLGDNELRDFSQIPSEEFCKSSKIKKNQNPVWNGKERFLLGIPGSACGNLFNTSINSSSLNYKKSGTITPSSNTSTSTSFNDKKTKSYDNLESMNRSVQQSRNFYLLIQVFSHDRLKKDPFIGSARIGPLSKLPYGVLLSKTVTLHESTTQGSCTIKFIAHNFGLTWEEFEEMDASNEEFLTFKPVCADPVKAVLDKIADSRYAGQFPNQKDEGMGIGELVI